MQAVKLGRQTKTDGQYPSTTDCMRTRFLVPPVGRRSTVSTAQVKTKTKPSLEGKPKPKFAAFACLPLVGHGALKPSERRPASRSTDGSLQAHPSMRICCCGAEAPAISQIGPWEQHKGLMVKGMRGMGGVDEIWIWRKALTMGLVGG